MVGRDRGFKTRTGENGSFFVTAVVYDRDSIGEGKKGRAERERRKVERAHTDNWLVKGPREPVDGVEQEFPTRAPLVLAFRSKPRAYDLTDRCVLPLATVTQSRMELTYAIYGPGTTLDSHRENADKAESSLQPYERYEPRVQGLYQARFLSSARDGREIFARIRIVANLFVSIIFRANIETLF